MDEDPDRHVEGGKSENYLAFYLSAYVDHKTTYDQSWRRRLLE